MAIYYLDSSAIVKRYIVERGTSWIQTLTARHSPHTIYTARVTGPESIAGISRKVRVGEVSRRAFARASQDLRFDWRTQYRIIEVTKEVAEVAMDVAHARSLRGYDAVQLAAALSLHRQRSARFVPALTFVSADRELLQVAEAESLLAEKPNDHP